MTPDIERIYQQFLDGRCPREDVERLLDYFQTRRGHADMVALIEQELDKPVAPDEYGPVAGFSPATHLDRLRDRIGFGQPKTRRLRGWLPYVAAVLFALAAGLFFLDIEQQAPNTRLAATDILPGGNRATLTMADGRKINLSKDQSGIVVGDGITYLDGSAVLSEQEHGRLSAKESGSQAYVLTRSLQLTTPKGGTYRITLPDGSKAWLNAASTLKYPSRFADNERVVELEGEAYFDVDGQVNKLTSEQVPFRVVSKGQVVEVLGTQFNISAYADETKTTLVEGSVKVSQVSRGSVHSAHPSTILVPGQQATTRGATLNIKKVDTEPYTAWKDGFFYFDNIPSQEAIEQLARWYDLEVVYHGVIPQVLVFGMIDRTKPLSSVLKSLGKSGLKFEVQESDHAKRLIVLGKK